MIKISDLAKNKVIELMSNDGFIPEQDFIRVGVKSGGCSGPVSYTHLTLPTSDLV